MVTHMLAEGHGCYREQFLTPALPVPRSPAVAPGTLSSLYAHRSGAAARPVPPPPHEPQPFKERERECLWAFEAP